MALYIYQKFNAQYNSGYYYLTTTGSNTSSGSTVSGWTSYSFNSNTGTISMAGNSTSTSSGTLYGGGGSSMTAYSISGGQRTDTYYQSYYSSSYYSRGTLVGQVIAEDGTYPANGQHSDGFFYERKALATAPTIISPNGGEIFNAVETITWQTPRAGLKYKVEISLDNGQTWTTLIAETATDATSFTRDYTSYIETGLAKVRVTGIDGTLLTAPDESNGVFTIRHNVAPSAPTLIEPIGVTKNVENIVQFVWRHNDTDSQSKAEIRIREQGYTAWLSNITVSGSQQEAFAQVDPGIAPSSVEWQVRTYDQQNEISPWSPMAVFKVAYPTDEPIITSPITTAADSRPIIQWTSPGQVSYQIVITDTANVVLWDTGEITSTVKSRTSGIDFINGATYRINVRSKDINGVFSDYAQVQVLTSYTTPIKPTGTISANEANNGLLVAVTNPPPQGSSPSVIRNEFYKYVDERWLLIASGTFTSYTDYTVTSGESYAYKVRAVGSNTTFSETTLLWGKVFLKSPELAIASNPSTSIVLKTMTQTTKQRSRDRSLNYFEGRQAPMAEFGKAKAQQLAFEFVTMDIAEVNEFYSFIDLETTLLYRDPQGRKEYITVDATSETESHAGALFRVSFTADKVWFKEGTI